MKKIRLDLDSLDVVSFTTAGAGEPRGTVRGHLPLPYANVAADYKYEITEWPSCLADCAYQTNEYDSCEAGGPSCGASCDWVCGAEHDVAVDGVRRI